MWLILLVGTLVSILVTQTTGHMLRSALPTNAPTTQPVVFLVILKILPFWPADPEIWLAQVEAQFTTCDITVQMTKFENIVTSLSPEYATEVRYLIPHPPATDAYDALKTELIKRTTASEQTFTTTLQLGGLGDQMPSQLLRHMKQLLGNKAILLTPLFFMSSSCSVFLLLLEWFWPSLRKMTWI